MKHLLSIAILLLLICGCCTRAPVSTNGIPALAEVDSGIYRGGYPTPEGFRWLRSHGVTNYIKLNPEDQSPKKPAEDAGLKVFQYPIDTDDQIFGSPDNAGRAALKLAQLGRGTYVGCLHGEDRTGLVIAIYRVRHDGWSKKDAEAEMISLGFHKQLLGLWSYWQKLKP